MIQTELFKQGDMKEVSRVLIYQPWSAPLIHLTLPDSIYFKLLDLTDRIANDVNAKKEGHELAGEIETELHIEISLLKEIGFDKHIIGLSNTYFEILANQHHYPMVDGKQHPSDVLWQLRKRLDSVDIMEAWFNDQKDNEYNPKHQHAGILSGVLYLKIPKYLPDRKLSNKRKIQSQDGAIEFSADTSETTGSLTTPVVTINPKEKDILLFPSVLSHQVYPFRTADGKGIRRSMSFNLECSEMIEQIKQEKGVMLTQEQS